MQPLRVGDVVYNLDMVREVRYARKGAPGKTPSGVDSPLARDVLLLAMSDGTPKYLYDADAADAWAAITSLGSAPPPGTPPGLDAVRRMAWRLVVEAENGGWGGAPAARELATRLDALCGATRPSASGAGLVPTDRA